VSLERALEQRASESVLGLAVTMSLLVGVDVLRVLLALDRPGRRGRLAPLSGCLLLADLHRRVVGDGLFYGGACPAMLVLSVDAAYRPVAIPVSANALWQFVQLRQFSRLLDPLHPRRGASLPRVCTRRPG
jgi:hypothetical protein